MSTFLRSLAIAHQHHEGWYPGSYSYRQNNPGNLRGRDGKFMVFKTYEDGLAALEYDLLAKISGKAQSIKNLIAASGRPYEKLVMQDYVSIYAPAEDSNNPTSYCRALCNELKNYNIQPSTPLSVLNDLATGKINRVPDAQDLTKKLAAAQNSLKWAKGERMLGIMRLIERLKKLIHS